MARRERTPNSLTATRLVVVIPIGPRCQEAFVCDTIESIKAYTAPQRVIVLIDDSGSGTGASVARAHPDVDVLQARGGRGRHGGLYLNLANAFAHALRTYDFEVLLRIDTDALVIGPHPEDDALYCFGQDHRVASAGNYLYEYGGALRDRKWTADNIERQTRTLRGFVRHPVGALALWRTVRKAAANGYSLGEEVFGGAAFYSYEGLAALAAARRLPQRSLANSTLHEDEIFGLTLRTCGYHFADLWEYNGSFACGWNDLPDDPESLLQANAKVIHSVRDYRALPESEIREFFRRRRNGLAREESVTLIDGTGND